MTTQTDTLTQLTETADRWHAARSAVTDLRDRLATQLAEARAAGATPEQLLAVTRMSRALLYRILAEQQRLDQLALIQTTLDLTDEVVAWLDYVARDSDLCELASAERSVKQTEYVSDYNRQVHPAVAAWTLLSQLGLAGRHRQVPVLDQDLPWAARDRALSVGRSSETSIYVPAGLVAWVHTGDDKCIGER